MGSSETDHTLGNHTPIGLAILVAISMHEIMCTGLNDNWLAGGRWYGQGRHRNSLFGNSESGMCGPSRIPWHIYLTFLKEHDIVYFYITFSTVLADKIKKLTVMPRSSGCTIYHNYYKCPILMPNWRIPCLYSTAMPKATSEFTILPKAYRLLKEKRACSRHLAKFICRLKILQFDPQYP